MGRVLRMAVVAALTPLAALAPDASRVSSPTSSPASKIVECPGEGLWKEVTISAPGIVVIECPPTYTFKPEVTGNPKDQQVCDTPKCGSPQLLTSCCPYATLKPLLGDEKTKGDALTPEVETAAKASKATLTIETLPVDKEAVFYLQCEPPAAETRAREDTQKQACVVGVTVEKAQPQGGAGGVPVVHVCTQPSASIRVSLPDQGSSVQFACETQFNLYPADAKRVFKDDCKTEEDLKDMTRTHAAGSAPPTPAPPSTGERSAASSSTIYTLRADKKPPRRTLCYLCAKEGVTAEKKRTPKDDCTIYVESSARAQRGLQRALTLMLSCVLAVVASA